MNRYAVVAAALLLALMVVGVGAIVFTPTQTPGESGRYIGNFPGYDHRQAFTCQTCHCQWLASPSGTAHFPCPRCGGTDIDPPLVPIRCQHCDQQWIASPSDDSFRSLIRSLICPHCFKFGPVRG